MYTRLKIDNLELGMSCWGKKAPISEALALSLGATLVGISLKSSTKRFTLGICFLDQETTFFGAQPKSIIIHEQGSYPVTDP